jgi:RNA polymerase sigma-70 factor (ECF subfamily)
MTTRDTTQLARRRRPTATPTAPRVREDRRWSDWSDEDLLVEYARQETREAFETLVHRFERELYSYLGRYLGDRDLAEDAFQLVFLEVHLRRRQFDPRRRFRPWLYRIATTKAIDLLRRNRRHNLPSLDAPRHDRSPGEPARLAETIADRRAAAPADRIEANEDREKVRLLARSFPDRLRDVLVLVMFGGLAYQEAADALGIPLGTVKSRLHEAVLRLRKGMIAA